MTTGLQLFSTVKQNGSLVLSLEEVQVKKPVSGEVLIRVEASPINPSDMWPMFGPADLTQARLSDDGKSLTAPIAPAHLSMVRARLDQKLPIGNEGAGTVIEAGEGAEDLLGKTVSVQTGACFAQYVTAAAQTCLPHNDTTTAEQAASSFVNPLTALSMIENMHLDGFKGLVHTAAASNLGLMLNRICLQDDVPLVNVVRSQTQVDTLKAIGAKHVVDSSVDSFHHDLCDAIANTDATLAFDATGGGRLADDILRAMEAYLSRDATGLNSYGSTRHKQVYLYGGLDVNLTTLSRHYGMSWGVGGWLMPNFLARIGWEKVAKLQKRVADEIDTTFASHYSHELSLNQVLSPEHIGQYVAKKTGEKFLIQPQV